MIFYYIIMFPAGSIINYNNNIITATVLEENFYRISFYKQGLYLIKIILVERIYGFIVFVSACNYVYIVYANENDSTVTFYDIYVFEASIENILSFDNYEIISTSSIDEISKKIVVIEYHISYHNDKIEIEGHQSYSYNEANKIVLDLVPIAIKDELFVPFFKIEGSSLIFDMPYNYEGVKYMSLGTHNETNLYYNKTGVYELKPSKMKKVNLLL